MKRFVYSSKSFCLSTSTWTDGQLPALSTFDKQLRSGWDSAMENGHFRYKIDQMKTRRLPGHVQYILQLNELRGRERRKPDHINSVRQPFNPEKFNFTKIKPAEVLFRLCPEHSINTQSVNIVTGSHSNSAEQISNGHTDNSKEEDNHLVLINVSPLEYGHILLVPHVDRCLPQLLTEEGVRLGMEMMLLSEHRGFRIGYNSLCAYASVNHLHLHGWYLDHQIGIEYTPVREFGNVCHVTTEWPVPAFVFQLHGSTVEKLSRRVQIVVSYFQEQDVAHNLMIVRGVIFGESKDSPKTTVRVYLWPRASFIVSYPGALSFAKAVNGESSHGAKNEGGVSIFNPAVAELGGHVPVYFEDKFEVLTEEDILSGIRDCLLPDEEFSRIQDAVFKLLKHCEHDTSLLRNFDSMDS